MHLSSFLSPRSIALVGASNKPGKVGYALAKKLLHYPATVSFVNSKRYSIFGKQCFDSLLEIPSAVDLAVIAVSASSVLAVFKECVQRKIPSVVIISAGFSEAGNGETQKQLVALARTYAVRFLGPNTFGLVNTHSGLHMTFAKSEPLSGHIGFLSQSGALWSSIVEYGNASLIGFSSFISLGDMADLDFTDFLPVLEKDSATRTILCYVESLHDGKKFMNAAKNCKKPLIFLKGGKTVAGSEATYSHTGNLAGSYQVYTSAFRQAGGYVAETPLQALDLADYLSFFKHLSGKRVLIITNAGGPGILCADALTEYGFEIVALPKLPLTLPSNWSNRNPLDLAGDADVARYRSVFNALKRRHNFFDTVVVLSTPQTMIQEIGVAKEILFFSKKIRKPVFTCFLGSISAQGAYRFLRENHLPCFTDLERFHGIMKGLIQRV
ncbi:CoA-binding protein [Candidatus Woesearchaeota archaeon]|nr:CoA-binding protein [Candidatus Woesearchaeota archaeon]